MHVVSGEIVGLVSEHVVQLERSRRCGQRPIDDVVREDRSFRSAVDVGPVISQKRQHLLIVNRHPEGQKQAPGFVQDSVDELVVQKAESRSHQVPRFSIG